MLSHLSLVLGISPPARGIHFLSASHMPSCDSLAALGIMGKMLEREHLTGPLAIGLALGTPLFPYKGMWDGEKPVPS